MKLIANRQVALLSFFLSQSIVCLYGFSFLFQQSGCDTLLTILGGTLLGIFFLIILVPKKSIKQKQSRLMALVLLLFFLFFGYDLLSQIANYIHFQMMPRISILMIAFSFLLLGSVISKKGIEQVARMSEILFFFFLFFFTISLIGLGPHFHFSYLKPLFTTEPLPLLLNCFYYAVLSVVPVLLLLIVPFPTREATSHKRSILWGYLGGSLILLLLAILSLGILGIPLVQQYAYPFVIILKKIMFFGTFGRFELILSLQFLFGMILSMILLLIAIRKQLRLVFSSFSFQKQEGLFVLSFLFLFLGATYIPHFPLPTFVLLCIFLVGMLLRRLLLFGKEKSTQP